MRNRSPYGGRHELGQNFLTHRPTIVTMIDLISLTDGPILEIGAGNGALTAPLATLGRPVRAIDLDEYWVARLRRRLPGVEIDRADAMRERLDRPVIVGNLPYHLTTPLLRRLLSSGHWRDSIVLTQWEVARKRAGVGGGTMMTAQSSPWFTFELHGRVPSHGFTPRPSVDGGILAIRRRATPLVDGADRRQYERFVRDAFTGRGHGMAAILRGAAPPGAIHSALHLAGVAKNALPRDVTTEQWPALWHAIHT